MTSAKTETAQAVATMLQEAAQNACRRCNTSCPWLSTACEVLRRAESAELPLEALEVCDAWENVAKAPQGAFSLYFYAETEQEAQAVKESLQTILQDLQAQGRLEIARQAVKGALEIQFFLETINGKKL